MKKHYNNATGCYGITSTLVIVSDGMDRYLHSINVPRILWSVHCIYCNKQSERFSTFRNWMFVLQRFTGVFLVIFIAWHIFQTRIQKALGAEVEL